MSCRGWYDPQGNGREDLLEKLAHLELMATLSHLLYRKTLGQQGERNLWLECLNL